MPYGKAHYPFENRKEFEETFPADFIAEGIDQTRGWFYTLIVVSTLLFGKAPFKNLVCNGLVLAADGQKMSKRKKNYPDPMSVVNKYGADAVSCQGRKLAFQRRKGEEIVRDILKDVFLPWYNAYRFLSQYVTIWEQETGEKFLVNEKETYRMYTVTPRLWVKFIDHFTNWYVSRNRSGLRVTLEKMIVRKLWRHCAM
ncbi:hypothetical protein Btru_058193 [Bulinus truncatus]|nr:hypothetical protein Btru_058193 [Bulinus truncatus]